MSRQHVYLSPTLKRARSVGGWRAKNPIILKMKAGKAQRTGLDYFSPATEHFLARNIPTDRIDFPEEEYNVHF